MKIVSMIKTDDGSLHETVDRAKHHAEERYGRELSKLAHQLSRLEKYTAILDFVDEHINEFVKLNAIKQDIELERLEED